MINNVRYPAAILLFLILTSLSMAQNNFRDSTGVRRMCIPDARPSPLVAGPSLSPENLVKELCIQESVLGKSSSSASCACLVNETVPIIGVGLYQRICRLLKGEPSCNHDGCFNANPATHLFADGRGGYIDMRPKGEQMFDISVAKCSQR